MTALTKRLAVLTLVAGCLVALSIPESANAQGGSLTSSTTQVDVHYGDRLVFRVEASANAILSGARLTAQVTGTNRIVSEIVDLVPGESVSTSHSLSVDSLQVPPFAEIVYYWDFQDQNGVAYQTPPETLWYEDTQVPWTWQPVTQADITVFTDGRSEPVSAAVLDVATRALTEAERTLGTRYEGQMRIYVYPDLAAMAAALQAHQLQIRDWVAAYALPTQQTALISASAGPTLVDTLQRDVPHEVSHLVLAQVAGEMADALPGWFSEGMALNAAGSIDPALGSVLVAAISDHRLIPLASLCAPTFSGLPAQSAELAYAQSASVFNFIQERYGTGQIRSLLQAWEGGASCDGALRQSLGISLAQLESQWHNGAVEQPATDLNASGSVTLWIVIWAISAGLALLFLAPQTLRSQDASEEVPDLDRTQPIGSLGRPGTGPTQRT